MVSKGFFCPLSGSNCKGKMFEHPYRYALVTSPYSNFPQAALPVKANPFLPARVVLLCCLVSLIACLAGLAKIAKPVVRFVAVNVVDLIRKRSNRDNPANSCNGKVLSQKPNLKVPCGAFVTNRFPSFPVSSGFFSRENPSFAVVIENFGKFTSGRVFDHFMPSLKGLYYGIH